MHPSSRTEALLTLLSKYPSVPLPPLPSAALQSEALLTTYLESLSTKGPDLTSLLTLARARRDLPTALLALAALLDSGPTAITAPQMDAWESFSQDVSGEVSTAKSQVDWCEEVGAGWLTGVDPSAGTSASSAASAKPSPSSSCQNGSLVVKMDCSRTQVTGEGRQVRSYQRGNVVYEGFDGFSHGHAHWTWEIVDETDSQGTCLGVTTLPHDKEDYSDSKTHAVVRAYNGHTYIFGSGERDAPPSAASHPQGFKFFKGDMVRFDLDMDALTLAMSVNGQTRGMVCEGSVLEGKTLYPCISFYSEDRCCRLVEIEHVVKGGGEGGEGEGGRGGVLLTHLPLDTSFQGVGECHSELTPLSSPLALSPPGSTNASSTTASGGGGGGGGDDTNSSAGTIASLPLWVRKPPPPPPPPSLHTLEPLESYLVMTPPMQGEIRHASRKWLLQQQQEGGDGGGGGGGGSGSGGGGVRRFTRVRGVVGLACAMKPGGGGVGGGKKAVASEEEGEKPPTLTSPLVFQVAVCGGGGNGNEAATIVWESAPVVSPLQPPQEFNIPFQDKGGQQPQSLVLTVSFLGSGTGGTGGTTTTTTTTTLKAVWGNVTLLHQPPWLAPALGLHWREALDKALSPPAMPAADMLSSMQGGTSQAALVLATLSQLTSLALLHHVALALVAYQGRVQGVGGVGAEEGGIGGSKPFPNNSSPPPPFAPTSHASSMDAASALATAVLKRDAGANAELCDTALAHIFTILMVGGVRDGAAAAPSTASSGGVGGPSPGDDTETFLPTSPSLAHLLNLARECQTREPCPPYLSTAAAAFLHVFLSPQERVGEVERLLLNGGDGGGGYTLELTLLPHHLPPSHAPEDTMVAIQVHALERGVDVSVGGMAGTKTSLVVKVPNVEGVGELLALLPNLGDLFVDFRLGRGGGEGVGGMTPLATQCIVDPNCRLYATLSKYTKGKW